MFGAVTKLFDRNFAVGYFLPATFFLIASLGLWWPEIGIRQFLGEQQQHVLLVIGLAAFACWSLAVSLLAANRRILDVKSGYGLLNTEWDPLLRWRLRRFDKLKRRENEASSGASHRNVERAFELAKQYPQDRGRVLPLAFGNRLCASESYANEMYGFDAVTGWPRLLAVIPADYRVLLEATKSQMDFLVNLWLLSLFFLLETGAHFVLDSHWQGQTYAWFGLGAVASAALASHWSLKAAEEWGDLVKTAYDVYLPTLREKLGFARPGSRIEEREQWQSFSQAIAFHEVGALPELPAPSRPITENLGQLLLGAQEALRPPAADGTSEDSSEPPH